MKVRLQSEKRKGRPRWYLVRSEYAQGTGKRTLKRILYLGYPPNSDIRKLVARLNKSLSNAKCFPSDNPIVLKIKEAKSKLREKEMIKRRIANRKELQAALHRNLFSDIVNWLAGANVKMDEFEKECAFDRRPRDEQEKILAEMEPIKRLIERAEKIREDRSKVGTTKFAKPL